MKFIERYQLNKEHSHTLHSENRMYLRRIFIVSIIFGIAALSLVEILNPADSVEIKSSYYSFYIIVGTLGLVLCYISHLHYTPIFFCIISFYCMLTFFLTISTMTEFFVYFVAFSFVVVMLLNINPFVFTVTLLMYDIVLTCLVQNNIIVIKEKLVGPELMNIIVLNSLVAYCNLS